MRYIELDAANVESILGTTGNSSKKPSRVMKIDKPKGATAKKLSEKTLKRVRAAYARCREGKKSLKELNLKIEQEQTKFETRFKKLKEKGEKEKAKELKVKYKDKIARLQTRWDKEAYNWFQEHNDGRKG